jgi:NAD(P)-dependent dehydrogenase (short-subunit alcohol dehydrogenase family)
MISEQGGHAVFVKADVSQAAEVEAMIDHTVQAYGRLDYAFNNAGIVGGDALPAHRPEQVWDRVIDINLKGVWLCMRYEIPQMLKQGKGAIVNMASIAGLVGFVDLEAYVASKHGVVGLTKAAALEYAKQNVRINAVCPGYIRTPLIERGLSRVPASERADHEQRLMDQHPIGRLGTPKEVAEAVVWLCSDAASFVTGHAMPVDGGYVAQ